MPQQAILVIDGAYAEYVDGYDGGAALVTAMLVASLAAAVVATLAASQSLWLRSVELRRDQVQAQAIVLAGLAWARDAVRKKPGNDAVDHLASGRPQIAAGDAQRPRPGKGEEVLDHAGQAADLLLDDRHRLALQDAPHGRFDGGAGPGAVVGESEVSGVVELCRKTTSWARASRLNRERVSRCAALRSAGSTSR